MITQRCEDLAKALQPEPERGIKLASPESRVFFIVYAVHEVHKVPTVHKRVFGKKVNLCGIKV